MTYRQSIDLVVHGVISKAVKIARSHGHYAYGHEAKVMAEFIASEIEHLDDPLYAWGETEAGRIVAEREDRFRTMVEQTTAKALLASKAATLRAKRSRARDNLKLKGSAASRHEPVSEEKQP